MGWSCKIGFCFLTDDGGWLGYNRETNGHGGSGCSSSCYMSCNSLYKLLMYSPILALRARCFIVSCSRPRVWFVGRGGGLSGVGSGREGSVQTRGVST